MYLLDFRLLKINLEYGGFRMSHPGQVSLHLLNDAVLRALKLANAAVELHSGDRNLNSLVFMQTKLYGVIIKAVMDRLSQDVVSMQVETAVLSSMLINPNRRNEMVAAITSAVMFAQTYIDRVEGKTVPAPPPDGP
jgi:hypothetical protein